MRKTYRVRWGSFCLICPMALGRVDVVNVDPFHFSVGILLGANTLTSFIREIAFCMNCSVYFVGVLRHESRNFYSFICYSFHGQSMDFQPGIHVINSPFYLNQKWRFEFNYASAAQEKGQKVWKNTGQVRFGFLV